MIINELKLRSVIKEIILEKSNLNEAFTNLRKIGRDLKNWNGSTGDKREKLQANLEQHLDDLNDALAAGEFDKRNLSKKAAAEKLKDVLEKIVQGKGATVKGAEVEGATKEVEKVEPAKAEPESAADEKDDDWVKYKKEDKYEYQVRDCTWYTKNTATGKEFKLGPTKTTSGKFGSTIYKLNTKFPDKVKGCELGPKPEPKPATGDKKDFKIVYANGSDKAKAKIKEASGKELSGKAQSLKNLQAKDSGFLPKNKLKLVYNTVIKTHLKNSYEMPPKSRDIMKAIAKNLKGQKAGSYGVVTDVVKTVS